MNFYEWYYDHLPGIPEFSDELKNLCKKVWDAAIEAAQKELKTEEYYWHEMGCTGRSYPEKQIDALKV